MESLEFRYDGKGKSYDYLVKALKGEAVSDTEFVVNNDYFKSKWFVYETEDFRVLATKIIPLQDYQADSIQNLKYDYTVRFFTRSLIVKSNDKELNLSLPNGFVVLKKGDHIFYKLKKGQEIIQVALSFNEDRINPNIINFLKNENSNLYYIGDETLISWLNSFDLKIRDKIYKEYLDDWVRLKLRELEILFWNSLKHLESKEKTNNKFFHSDDVQIIFSIREDILNNLKNKPVLASLAKEHGMNISKMTFLFKELFGNTIYKFYKEQKLLEVKRLIEETTIPFGEIAFDFKFTDISHFSKSCIQAFGVSPSKLRGTKAS